MQSTSSCGHAGCSGCHASNHNKKQQKDLIQYIREIEERRSQGQSKYVLPVDSTSDNHTIDTKTTPTVTSTDKPTNVCWPFNICFGGNRS